MGRAYQDGAGGDVPNCRSLAQLVAPQDLLSRPGGVKFLLYDSGPAPERIAMFGAQSGSRCLQGANVWGADGATKAVPDLRAHLYTSPSVAV